MKKIFPLSTLVCLLFSFVGFSQSISTGFSINENNCDAYCIILELSSDGDFFLGSSSIRFSYDANVVSFSGTNTVNNIGTYTSINFDFNDGMDPNNLPDSECTIPPGFNNPISPYSDHGYDGGTPGDFLITWVLELPTTFGTPAACPSVGTTPVSVAEICFEVLDPDGDPNFQINGTENGPPIDLTGTNYNNDTSPPTKYNNGTLGELHTPFNDFCGTSQDIPTLSEWGLITLALLLMALGSLKMAVNSQVLVQTSNSSIPLPFNFLQLPICKSILQKTLFFTLLLATVGFMICYGIYGSIFFSDVVGVLISAPIAAYLLHLLYILEVNQ